MPKNINSSSRLISLLQSIPGHPDNTQTLDVWAKLFEISEAKAHKKAALVAERLSAMSREVELIREQMQKASFSEHLYDKATTHIQNALSAMLLPGTWNQVRQYLTPETFVALSFCAEIIPDEEALISPDELSSIGARVQELEDTLADAALPPRLHGLITHHVALIRRALAEYPISGAKSLREAARSALGEIVEAQEIVKSSRETPAISKLGAVWKQVNQAADAALKGEKLVQLGQKAWDLLGGIF